METEALKGEATWLQSACKLLGFLCSSSEPSPLLIVFLDSELKGEEKRRWTQIKSLFQSELDDKLLKFLTEERNACTHTFTFALKQSQIYRIVGLHKITYFSELFESELLTLCPIIHNYEGHSPTRPQSITKIRKLTLILHYQLILRSHRVLLTVPILSLIAR